MFSNVENKAHFVCWGTRQGFINKEGSHNKLASLSYHAAPNQGIGGIFHIGITPSIQRIGIRVSY